MKIIIRHILVSYIFSCSIVCAQKDEVSTDPVDLTFKVVKSPNGKSYFPDGKESYYTRYYRAAGLASLRDSREPKGNIRFRLAVLPSFTKPTFFTYFKDSKGVFIEVKRLSLKRVNNSIEPDNVELSAKIEIGKRDAEEFEYQVLLPEVKQTLKKLTEVQRQMYQGLDGTTWILEVSTDKEYTMEDIGSPSAFGSFDDKTLKEHNLPRVDAKAFIEFCNLILDKTDMKLPEYGAPDKE